MKVLAALVCCERPERAVETRARVLRRASRRAFFTYNCCCGGTAGEQNDESGLGSRNSSGARACGVMLGHAHQAADSLAKRAGGELAALELEVELL